MYWLSVSLAVAAEPAPEVERVRLSVRLLGEALADPQVALSYGGDGLGGEVAATVPVFSKVHPNLHATLEAGYFRRGGHLIAETGDPAEASSFWYLPMSLPVSWVSDLGAVQLGAGIGPSYLLYAEPERDDPDRDDDDKYIESGGKFGFVVGARASVRTRLVGRSLYDPGRGPAGLDVSMGIGYRHSFANLFGADAGEGHDLSAARVTLGLDLVY